MKIEIRHSTNIKDTPFIDQWLESLSPNVLLSLQIKNKWSKE